MKLSSIPASLALTFVMALPLAGCVYEEGPPVEHAARGGRRGDVPFRGMYSKYAESTFKNGRRIRVANANGPATVRIEHGRLTYDQSYVSHGDMKRVVQVYSFHPHDVQSLGGGEYEVNLTFRSIGGDTSGYSPDRNNPKMEARRTAQGWEISLFTTDNNGVVGVVELQ